MHGDGTQPEGEERERQGVPHVPGEVKGGPEPGEDPDQRDDGDQAEGPPAGLAPEHEEPDREEHQHPGEEAGDLCRQLGPTLAGGGST